MKIELKKNCKYALVVPTSMGSASLPQTAQPVHSGGAFMMQVTSAETNVASISSYLGLPVKVLTTFVKGSPDRADDQGQPPRRNMDFEGAGSAARRAVGISPSVQHRRQRLRYRAARACGMTAPAKSAAR